MAANNPIQIEIAYAAVNKQILLSLQVPAGSTILEAIQQSKLLELFPDINLEQQKVGVFSKQRTLTDVIYDCERIEIYRPLIIDPKEARRQKAKKT